MWYKNTYRRHLCDMHIDEWHQDFMSKFDPEEYVENLKTAKVKNAMIYFQSHVGLCYFPTKSGKMHNAFIGKEDSMKRLVDLCHENGISVTGYYSLIYNNVEHDRHPKWRMLTNDGISKRVAGGSESNDFAGKSSVHRYGFCCCNNEEYREFVLQQIKEMSEFFTVDGMFYDMLFWPHMCYCDSCKKRWQEEVGGEIPTVEDWSSDSWLFHIRKRREWMGEFAQWVTDETKKIFGDISVEHNVATSVLPRGTSCNCEEVINACDYAGGDLYIDPYASSFACKFYRSITKNQPFEYMVSRAHPNLGVHTQMKSEDHLKSSIFMTTAHHGASLVIDAINPDGTLNDNVYKLIGKAYTELEQYEPYMEGTPIEEIGIYYSLKSKFNPYGEVDNTNYKAVTETVKTMVQNHILCGVTGGFDDINKYKTLIASGLTDEDEYDNQRIIEFVKNGGNLYLSGYTNKGLLKEFFDAEVVSLSEEKNNYIVPSNSAKSEFEYYDEENPLSFWGSTPTFDKFVCDEILGTATLAYTTPNTNKFASIHSNPPGVKTNLPVMAIKKYGKGTVLWSAYTIERYYIYDHRNIFVNLIKKYLGFKSVLQTDADEDIEITAFRTNNGIQVNTVLLNTSYKARKVADFEISIYCSKKPAKVVLLPEKKDVEFSYEDEKVTFKVKDMKLFNMYSIEL